MAAILTFFLCHACVVGFSDVFAPTPSTRKFSATSAAAVGKRFMSAAATDSSEWGLIFDCDGVILESESLHRDAYNDVFEEFDVTYRWSPEYYDELQNLIGGGKPKMNYYFGKHGWPTSKIGPPPKTEEDKVKLVDILQDRKTEIYKGYFSTGAVPVRPGFKRVVEEAKSIPGTKLAICSASTKSSCFFVLHSLLGEEYLKNFDVILAGDDVPRRKPDPMIYELASSMLGIPKDRCIVIEDSLIGLQAALGANMKCVITYTPSTKSQDFRGAAAVYSEFGEGEKAQVSASDLLNML